MLATVVTFKDVWQATPTNISVPSALTSKQKVTELSWQSTTRLLIHFGDAPCHGNNYHGGYARNGPDSYPGGDPTGECARPLASKEFRKGVLRERMCMWVPLHGGPWGNHPEL